MRCQICGKKIKDFKGNYEGYYQIKIDRIVQFRVEASWEITTCKECTSERFGVVKAWHIRKD